MWRQEKGITVRGENIPNPVLTFAETNFPKYMLDAFRRHNWTTPTDIQAQSWSVAMQGRDLVGIAKTGSGKTLSFGIPGHAELVIQSWSNLRDSAFSKVSPQTMQDEFDIFRHCDSFSFRAS